MIIVLQVAGGVAALIGVVALYYGIPVKEFSFGNTLILVRARTATGGSAVGFWPPSARAASQDGAAAFSGRRGWERRSGI